MILRKSKSILVVIIALLLFMTMTLSSCGGSNDSKLDSIKKSGKLVMYTNAEFPPYEYLGDNGDIVGVDVEIGNAIAKKLGVELSIENAAFDGIVASISSGKGDVAITGLTISEERKKEIDFSTPYVDSIQYLIVKDDSPINVVEDLAGKTVGSQTGTTGQMFLDDEIDGDEGVLKGKKAVDKPYNSAPIAMEDLKTGRIDAIIIDEQVAKQIANENDGYKAIPFNFKNGDPVGEEYGVGIAKGNEDLLAIIDEVIADILAKDQVSAWIKQYSVIEK